LISARATAATLQWNIVLGAGANCLQTVADGNGGVAIVVEEAGIYRIRWYGRDGTQLHARSGITGGAPVIISCDKKNLVYSYPFAGKYDLVQVGPNQPVTTVSAVNTHYQNYAGIALNNRMQRTNDRKGYFIERLDIPTNVSTLERYSFK